MMRWWLAVLAMAVALSAAGQASAPAPAWRGYDEAADARAGIERARASAAAGGKQVLLVFGANWCGDSRALDLAMTQGVLAPLVDARFVVVKVDVGRFDRNVDLAQRYGVPLKKGIPAIAVLAGDGSATFATKDGELASARSLSDEDLLRLFDRQF